MQRRVPLSPDAAHCSSCMLGHVCVPVGMPANEVEKLDELVKERVRVERGKTLYELDDPLDAVYGVRFGSLKTQLEDSSGQLQITGFHLPGEIVGLDGMIEQARLERRRP